MADNRDSLIRMMRSDANHIVETVLPAVMDTAGWASDGNNGPITFTEVEGWLKSLDNWTASIRDHVERLKEVS